MSAPATMRRATPPCRYARRDRAHCARRGVSIDARELAHARRIPCAPRLQAIAGASASRRPAAVRAPAERRRPRCHDVRRHDRYRHVVRPLRKRRHQPQSARDRHRPGCRYRRAGTARRRDQLRAGHDRCRHSWRLCRSSIATSRAKPRSSPSWSRCRATIRRATARRMRRAAQAARRRLASRSKRTRCRAAVRSGRHEERDQPDRAPSLWRRTGDRAQRAWRRGAARARLAPRSLWRGGRGQPAWPAMYGRGVAVSKSDFATYTWTLLALKAAAAEGARARRHGRAAFHLRRGDRRRDRAEMAARPRPHQARTT